MDETSRLSSALVMVLAALAFCALAGFAGRGKLNAKWGHPLAFALSVVLFGSISIEATFSGGGFGQAGIPLGVLGTGLLVYSRRWLSASAAMGAIYALPQALAGTINFDFLGSVVIATGLGFIAIDVRSRAFAEVRKLQHEAERRRREAEVSEGRFTLAVSGSSDGLYDWDHTTGEVYYSPRWKQLIGFEDHEEPSVGEAWDRIHPDDFDRVKQQLLTHLRGSTDTVESEFRILHKDGDYRWILARGASIRNDVGRVIRTAGSMTDMTGRGVFDALTGLPNRRLLLDRLTRALEHQDRGHMDFAVLFLDLDRFKLINDTLGHQAGDEMLVEVAVRLQSCVRASDTVARLGGDEFVVILERIDLPDGAYISIQRILSKLTDPFELRGQDFYIGASIGVVMDSSSYSSPEDLIRDADTAMYQAKASNQGWVIYDGTMRETFAARLHLENELRRAFEHNEFSLQYQPIVSLVDEQLECYEALVRWDHPERGTIGPDAFIETMEETGMILQLGSWVLETACREMMLRHPEGDAWGRPTLSVNVSRKQLVEKGFPDQVARVLRDTGFPASRLRLEITETAIVEQIDRAIMTLSEIKSLGIEIMMDDFGTGHSSLGALQDLPIDTLKIDRSFIARLGSSADGLQVVKTIIAMGTSMGLKIVAEGIETEQQLKLLRESACPSGQGFLISRPGELTAEPVPRDATIVPASASLSSKTD